MPERFACLLLLALPLPAVASDLPDPTRPYRTPSVQQQAATSFSVNAIFVSDERRVAIVNGQRVGIGSTVAGATVTAIEAESVTLVVAGRPMKLSLRARK